MNGVPLDNLPGGWRSLRLKWVLEALESGRREVSTTDGFEDGVLSVGGEHIGWQGQWLLENPRFVSREYYDAMTTGRIREDDILLVKDGATIGKVAIAQPLPAQECAVNEHVFLLRVNAGNHAKYYFYVVQSSLIQDQIQLEVRGSAQPGLNSEFRNVVVLPEPPELAQRSIAAFLDRETARIDRLIEKKRRQIELLQEKRAALISHAVTKGIDPSAPMKDSGIEWLGEVPDHWNVVQLRRIAIDLQTGPFGSQLHASDYVDGGIPIINPANIQNGVVVPDDRTAVSEDTFARLRRHALEEGDIVFGRRGEMGRCALIGGAERGFLCGTGSIRVRLRTSAAHPGFVALFLHHPGVHDHLVLESVGSTMDNLNTTIIGRIPVAVPPLQEQMDITKQIHREQTRIDHLTAKINISIDLLREYRTALISAAVTGKIDVRKEVA